MASALVVVAVSAIGLLAARASAQDNTASNTGYATYSNTAGGVCPGAASGLPGVAMNAAQFGGGSACGQCVQIQGSGSGAGQNPVSTAPYIAVVTNVCPQCAPGDIDLQESGDGKFGITWSFVACPGSGRRLNEGDEQLAEVTNGGQVATGESQGSDEAAVDSTEVKSKADEAEGTPADSVLSDISAASESSAATPEGSQLQRQASRKLLQSN